jgi:hypothetical protein
VGVVKAHGPDCGCGRQAWNDGVRRDGWFEYWPEDRGFGARWARGYSNPNEVAEVWCRGCHHRLTFTVGSVFDAVSAGKPRVVAH